MNPQDYFQENGYYVSRGLVSTHLIDRLLELYREEIVPATYPFFRQSTNKYEVNRLNEFGNVKQSFLDIHDYAKFSEFSTTAKEIYRSNLLLGMLQEITGAQHFNLMQTMLFDANTETQPHQDWWYLDTVPNGHLVGVWIALEDIHEEAGRFYVLPKSNQNPDFHSDNPVLSHSEWLARIRKHLEAHKSEISAPALQKGDVLFWNSKTIHGSLPTIDSRYSRKSLTGHYIPDGYQFGNLFATKAHISCKEYRNIKFYRNQPDYSLLNSLRFRIKTGVYDSPLLLKIMRTVQEKFAPLLRTGNS